MKFRNRKFYKHGVSKNIYLIQIPLQVCEDMGISKELLYDLEYKNGTIIVKLAEDNENG
jgi:hypothetical protein